FRLCSLLLLRREIFCCLSGQTLSASNLITKNRLGTFSVAVFALFLGCALTHILALTRGSTPLGFYHLCALRLGPGWRYGFALLHLLLVRMLLRGVFTLSFCSPFPSSH